MKITTVGIDLAKNVFHVHGVDQRGKVVVQKRLRRQQVLTFFTPKTGSELIFALTQNNRNPAHWRGFFFASTHCYRVFLHQLEEDHHRQIRPKSSSTNTSFLSTTRAP